MYLVNILTRHCLCVHVHIRNIMLVEEKAVEVVEAGEF